MASLQQIKRRIRSVQNTAKVTKAMEMVAASKMRRAQQSVFASRTYNQKITEVVSSLASVHKDELTIKVPLLESREIKKHLVILLTPDRGLCGGLHSNLNKAALNFMAEHSDDEIDFITVGKKGTEFMVRYTKKILATFTEFSDNPKLIDILPIAKIMRDQYSNYQSDAVYLLYPKFQSVVVQEITLEKILPIMQNEVIEVSDFIYEPTAKAVLEGLLPRYIEMKIYQALLELIASEYSARMVAMKNATDNANDMIDDLTLELNKARQNAITNELLDLVGGAEALK